MMPDKKRQNAVADSRLARAARQRPRHAFTDQMWRIGDSIVQMAQNVRFRRRRLRPVCVQRNPCWTKARRGASTSVRSAPASKTKVSRIRIGGAPGRTRDEAGKNASTSPK